MTKHPEIVGHNAPDGSPPNAPVYRRDPVPEDCEACAGCPDCLTNEPPRRVVLHAAVDEYVRACGGDPSREVVAEAAMRLDCALRISCLSCDVLRDERDRLQMERDSLFVELKSRTDLLMHRINELERMLVYRPLTKNA